MIRKQKLNADQNGNFDRVEERKKTQTFYNSIPCLFITIENKITLQNFRNNITFGYFDIFLLLHISVCRVSVQRKFHFTIYQRN